MSNILNNNNNNNTYKFLFFCFVRCVMKKCYFLNYIFSIYNYILNDFLFKPLCNLPILSIPKADNTSFSEKFISQAYESIDEFACFSHMKRTLQYIVVLSNVQRGKKNPWCEIRPFFLYIFICTN